MTTPATGHHPDPEGDRHDRPRHLLGLDDDDAELMRRLDDVLDRVDPVPDHVTAAAKAAYTAPADASTGVPRAPVEAPKPAGGATGRKVAPPAHHPRLTPRQRVLQRLLDLIGRKA